MVYIGQYIYQSTRNRPEKKNNMFLSGGGGVFINVGGFLTSDRAIFGVELIKIDKSIDPLDWYLLDRWDSWEPKSRV